MTGKDIKADRQAGGDERIDRPKPFRLRGGFSVSRCHLPDEPQCQSARRLMTRHIRLAAAAQRRRQRLRLRGHGASKRSKHFFSASVSRRLLRSLAERRDPYPCSVVPNVAALNELPVRDRAWNGLRRHPDILRPLKLPVPRQKCVGDDRLSRPRLCTDFREEGKGSRPGLLGSPPLARRLSLGWRPGDRARRAGAGLRR